MNNDLIVGKIQSIQRCINRAREEYAANPEQFDTNFTRQDAAMLNVLRACEQTIDLANHLLKNYKMGIPTTSAESFELLQKGQIISPALAGRLKNIVHFRNTLVHHYQQLDMAIVKRVLATGLDDLNHFTADVLRFVR